MFTEKNSDYILGKLFYLLPFNVLIYSSEKPKGQIHPSDKASIIRASLDVHQRHYSSVERSLSSNVKINTSKLHILEEKIKGLWKE